MTMFQPNQIKRTGADLTDYHLDLQKERSTRSLTMRRSTRPSIAGFLRSSAQAPKASLVDPSRYPFLAPDFAVEVLNSLNPTKIQEFTNNITATASASTKFLTNIAHSQDVCTALTETLSQELDPATFINLYNLLVTIFPLSDNLKDEYIDGGVTMVALGNLQCDDYQLQLSTVQLVRSLSENSSYARDSMLSFGLHNLLMEIAAAQADETLTIEACHSICTIFSVEGDIDSSFLKESVSPLGVLLDLEAPQAVCWILKTFVAMTNRPNTIILDLFEQGYVPKIIDMLDIEEVAGSAIFLIGNLSAAHPIHIQQMFEYGLFDKLNALVSTSLAGDVFWVFSNLVTAVPRLVIPLFGNEFVESAIEVAMTAAFEVKKEVVFFITTLILNVDSQEIREFLRPDVIDLIIEMLGCGVQPTIMSCLSVIQRFAVAMTQGELEEDAISQDHWEELRDALDDLAEKSPPASKEKASFLLSKIDHLVEGHH